MKNATSIIAAIAALTSATIPFAVCANASVADKGIVSTTESTDSSSEGIAVGGLPDDASNKAIIDRVNYVDILSHNAYDKSYDATQLRERLDGRDNEFTDRIYDNRLGQQSALHYDGDKVVKTDENLRDTITGEEMKDRKGNYIKVRELQKGSDSVTFRGDNGTTLKNVADGEVSSTSKEAINGSQLHAAEQKAADALANEHNQTQQTFQSQNAAIVNAQSTADANTKALEGKVDNSTFFEQTAAMDKNIAKNAKDIGKNADNLQKATDKLNGVSETVDAHSAAIVANAEESQKLWKDKASQKDVDQMLLTEAKYRETADDAITERQYKQQDTINDHTAAIADHEGRLVTAESDIANGKERTTALENGQSAIVAQADKDRKTTRSELNTKVNESVYREQLKVDQAKTATAQADADKANVGVADLSDRKVDKTVFDASQKAQDTALASHQSTLDNHGGRITTLEERTNENGVAITNVSIHQVKQDATLNSHETRINANAQANAKTADRVTGVEGRTTTLEKASATTNAKLQSVSDTADTALVVGNTAYHNTQVNAANIEQLNRDVSTVDARSASRTKAALQESKDYTNALNDRTNHRIDKLDSKVNGIGAMTGALTGLPQAIHAGHGNIAGGVGNYGSANAVAVGGSYRFDDDATTVKGSFATAGHNGKGIISLGASYEF